MKKIVNELCGILKSEKLVRYDMISFHIREGYVPYKRNKDFENLPKELASYRIHKNRDVSDNNITFLRYDPLAAKKYWQKVLEIERNIRALSSNT